MSDNNKSEVLISLDESIELWEHKLNKLSENINKEFRSIEQLCDELDITFGTIGCPLCKRFNLNGLTHCVGGCPIYNKTKLRCCQNTPYQSLINSISEQIINKAPIIINQKIIGFCKKEVKFLKDIKKKLLKSNK